MRSLERVNIRTNERTYVRTYVRTPYIRTGQTLYPLHNYVVRGDNEREPFLTKQCSSKGAITSTKIGEFYPNSNLTCIL